MFASVKKLSPAAQYLIKTPTGIAGVRGTELYIALNDDGTIKQVAVLHTHGDDGLVLAVTLTVRSQTFPIREGEVYLPGNPNPVPCPHNCGPC